VTAREWREAIDMRPSKLGLAAVLIGAAVLRFWSLGQGIPFAIGVDEPEIVDRVLRMMRTGDLHPHFYDYPTLYIYVQLAVACVNFLVGASMGAWRSLGAVTSADFYLWGRAITALFGTVTVYLVYQIGLRWGARHALLAAALLAVMPNHVRESHFVLTDVPATFFVTLAYLLSLRALEKGTPRAFAAAGAAAGLAAATKYYPGVAVLVPLVAAYLGRSGEHSRLRCALAAAGAATAAFLVGAPYTLLDLPGFLNGFAGVIGANPPASSAWAGTVLSAKHLRIALGWPGLLLALGGFGLGVVRMVAGPGRARFGLAVLLLAVYLPLVVNRGMIWARYLLPVVPVICLLAAIAVVSGVSLLRRFSIPRWARTTLIVALTVSALLQPTLNAIGWVRLHSRVSTQALAYNWIMAHMPAGTRVAVETRVLLLPQTRFQVEHFGRLIDRDLESYAAEGYDYFIASSQAFGSSMREPHVRPAEYAAYRRLFDRASLVFTVEPSNEHPGPELRVFRIPR
jgi:4-amino-4-deoxy-L-arabinose transferase-like glycosyltransferase